MEAYIAGDIITGDAKMVETRHLYKKVLQTASHCEEFVDKLEEFQKMDDMIKRPDWP